MGKLPIYLIFSAIFASFLLIYPGCKKVPDVPAPVYLVKLGFNPVIGYHLVDLDGNTLYYYADDYKGVTTCLEGCKDYWPYFYTDSLKASNLDPRLSLTDFDSINVNGVPQLRYKKWPLYYYSPYINSHKTREAPGQITGDGVGGIWFVMKPNYSVMLVHAQLTGSDGQPYIIKGDTAIPGTGKTIYLTDSTGLTLYRFSNDSSKINKYAGKHFSRDSAWSIYQTKRIVAPSALNVNAFSYYTDTIFRNNDTIVRPLLTYKGWPLYKYSKDSLVRGNMAVSDTIPAIWHVVIVNAISAP